MDRSGPSGIRANCVPAGTSGWSTRPPCCPSRSRPAARGWETSGWPPGSAASRSAGGAWSSRAGRWSPHGSCSPATAAPPRRPGANTTWWAAGSMNTRGTIPAPCLRRDRGWWMPSGSTTRSGRLTGRWSVGGSAPPRRRSPRGTPTSP